MQLKRRSVALTVAGVVAGLAASIALGTNLSDFLAQHIPDGLTLLGVTMALGALLSGFGPSLATLHKAAPAQKGVSPHEIP